MSERRVSLEILDVADPCTEDWAAMRGDERSRFCGLCRQSVFNLSAMTRDEAEELLASSAGQLCVRFYRRADGTVTTRDCAPSRLAALRLTATRTMTATVALFVSLLGIVLGLGIFRLSGVDVSRWLEDTAAARVAKATGLVDTPDTVEMGEPMEVMGAYVEPVPPEDTPPLPEE